MSAEIQLSDKIVADATAVDETIDESKFIKEYRKGGTLLLDLDPRIDLTMPIYEQVLRLEDQDKSAERKQQQSTAA